MILVSHQPFGISDHHAGRDPDARDRPSARGPVLRVRIRFEQWMEGKSLEADAFIDPGADFTLISSRWIEGQGGIGEWERPISYANDLDKPDHFLLNESAFVEIGGVELSLGDAVGITPSPTMPGYEDMLLGRDFLSAHHLLLVIDGEENTFSLLQPADEDNRGRREQIRRALDKPGDGSGDESSAQVEQHAPSPLRGPSSSSSS